MFSIFSQTARTNNVVCIRLIPALICSRHISFHVQFVFVLQWLLLYNWIRVEMKSENWPCSIFVNSKNRLVHYTIVFSLEGSSVGRKLPICVESRFNQFWRLTIVLQRWYLVGKHHCFGHSLLNKFVLCKRDTVEIWTRSTAQTVTLL